MTSLEKEDRRKLEKLVKGRAMQTLRCVEDQKKLLDSGDPRIFEYCRSVLSDAEAHNVYEVLAIERLLYLLGKYKWDGKKVRRFVKFYELLRFNSPEGRRRFKLTPVQAFQFGCLFGLRDQQGLRLCRLCYLFVPRKFSKTTSTAALAVDDIVFGDNNAQAYVGANSYQQAKICFDEIRAIMRDIDTSGRHIRINREQIFFCDGTRDAKAVCLAANARTQDGLNASLAIMDEYAQARDTPGHNGSDLKNVLTSSMGARKEPLTMVISTASEVIDGPFVRELDGARKVLRGEIENDRMLAFIFEPDADDPEDSPQTWAKVQPHLGITVQQDFYANEWANAQLCADNMLAFRTKMLNIFCVNEKSAWLSADLIRECSKKVTIPEDMILDSTVGVDLSVRGDLSAVTTGIQVPWLNAFYYDTAYFMPEQGLKGHPNEKIYRRWADEGHLILLPGEVIDYRFIADYIVGINDKTRTMAIGYDPAHSEQLLDLLKAAGAGSVLRPIRQRFIDFTAVCENFEVATRTGHIIFAPNPITPWCIGNAVLLSDSSGNFKPMKKSENLKIDGLITILQAHKCFAEVRRSPL